MSIVVLLQQLKLNVIEFSHRQLCLENETNRLMFNFWREKKKSCLQNADISFKEGNYYDCWAMTLQNPVLSRFGARFSELSVFHLTFALDYGRTPQLTAGSVLDAPGPVATRESPTVVLAELRLGKGIEGAKWRAEQQE